MTVTASQLQSSGVASTRSMLLGARSNVGSPAQIVIGIGPAVTYLLAAGARQDQIVLAVLAVSSGV